MNKARPLVLDVDGTFLRTDMLFECFWSGLSRAPWKTIKTAILHMNDRARLKQELAAIAQLRTDLLPTNAEIKRLADEGKASGREVVLASASDQKLVEQLATEHGLSSRVFASDGAKNMKGSAKAAALVDAFGEGGFDYAGDSSADKRIWPHADTAIIVGAMPSAKAELTAAGINLVELSGGWRKRDLLRALRPHQWVKNVLLFLPILAAHDFTLHTFLLVALGMASFSAAASCIYVVNDLLDLEADRLHATKHRRPFASGAVPISVGMAACAIVGMIALGISLYLGWAFFAVILTYMALSLAYSLRLKRMRWIDIATLASLYTIRVLAGAAAGKVFISGFMLVFIFPVFISLGCVKRLTEVALADTDARLPGRGYGKPDRGDLLNVASLGVLGALGSFFLYTLTEQARELYPTLWLLWVAMVPMALWLIRMVRLGYFGRQDYDPIVFALRDKRGLGLLMFTLALMFYAAGIWQRWFGF
ncbi:MAG: UbiA family prenyltransferase [Paracoccaceae bacterium]|nr:UbiA family prenyltransferase [Paracoccaceae bacterium]